MSIKKGCGKKGILSNYIVNFILYIVEENKFCVCVHACVSGLEDFLHSPHCSKNFFFTYI